MFVVTLHDSASPDYGSGASIGGVGLVLILGVGLILLGLVFMFYQRARDPAYFRGQTLVRDTPALVVDEPSPSAHRSVAQIARVGMGFAAYRCRSRTPGGTGPCSRTGRLRVSMRASEAGIMVALG